MPLNIKRNNKIFDFLYQCMFNDLICFMLGLSAMTHDEILSLSELLKLLNSHVILFW